MQKFQRSLDFSSKTTQIFTYLTVYIRFYFFLFFTIPEYLYTTGTVRLCSAYKNHKAVCTRQVQGDQQGVHLALLSFRQSKSKRFESLVSPHLRALHGFAYRLTGSQHDAEDLVQDVITKLVPKVDELERVDELRPWLHRVTYRQFVDNIRKRPIGRETSASTLDRADQQTPFLDTLPGAAPDPVTHTEDGQQAAVLRRLIGELKPDQRTLLLMHDSEGWRLEEISEVLDIPLGTVKSRLHRVRALLRTKLQEEMEPSETEQRGCQ